MIKSLSIHSLRLCRWLPYPALLSAVAAFSLGANVQAQDGDELEEVTVTGSRIVRRDYVSNSPIVTIEAEQFEQQTGLNIESYLNQLPEYNPAASPVTAANQDVQITPTNSVGIASISLRGFGPNRNLVLVDGHRPVPVNALMVTDINGIPSSLIQRAETITGGASAVYGADAVGGVTNFIVRKDYEGFEFDGQYGITEDGDGDENRISMLFGTNFADDRGNVTFSAERYERKAAMQIERDYYKDYWASPDTPGYFFFNQGINAYSCSPVCPTYGALRSLYGGQNPSGWWAAPGVFGPGSNGNSTPWNGAPVSFNPDGTIFSPGAPIGLSRIDPATIDGLHYAYQTVLNPLDSTNSTTAQGLKWNRLDGFASSPQDRYSFFASGNFDLTDTISVFARGRWAESKTETTLFGTDAISGWETNVPFTPATDSPITGMVYNDATYAAVAAAADPAAYLLANYANPNFIPHGEGTVKYCSAGVGGCPAAGITDLANNRVGTATAALVNTLVPYHPVPVELAWLLNSRSNPSARWQPQWFPETSLPPRSTYNTIATWQMEGGVDFEIPFRDWSGEVYFSHGESDTYNVASGNLSLARYRALANQPDWGAGTTGTGNTFYAVGQNAATATVVSTIRPTFGSGDFACTSGFYDTFFGGDQQLSKDCYDAVNAVLQTRTEMDQEVVEVNLQGGVYDLPAGELRMAIGYQRRATEGKFFPDILQSQDSFTDQVIGVYPTGYLDASTLVNDYYVEALVPVVKDLPYVQSFELELGARYSDYEGEGVADASYDPTLTGTTEWTYKILGSLEVKDWLRLRGGYNLATRAPNLGEMFLNPQEIFTGGGNFGDPCSVRANAPWGAGGTTLYDDEVISGSETAPVLASGQDTAGANRTADICTALMGLTGAADYYNGIVGGVDSNRDFTQQGAGGGFAWVIQKGNPDLRPETAKTFTAGFVMSSPIENAWLSGITLAFDWYMVNIKNTIMTYSIDYANYRCFGAETGLSAAEQAATPACQLLPRDQVNGAALSTVLSYDNQATIETSGFDVMFNWGSEIADLGLINLPGRLGFNMQATILDYYKTRQSPAPYDVEVEWKGSLGPNLSGTQGGAYDYRLFGSLSYSLNNWSASLRWRHLPGVYSAGYAEQQALKANNAAVLAGGPGLILTYTPTTEIETNAYDVFDLSANWSINETFSLRAGITNLADKRPTFVAPSAGRPATEWDTAKLAAVCGGAPGCTNPSSFSLPSLGSFNGGYYDTLGRRFFVGFKASY